MDIRRVLTGIAFCFFAMAGLSAVEGGGSPRSASPEDYERIKATAESLVARDDYAGARTQYEAVNRSKLPEAEVRWVEFRLADTAWRAESQGSRVVPERWTQFGAALEKVLASNEKPEERDLAWAEASESLGDFQWARPGGRIWSFAWKHHRAALEWWAGSTDISQARGRYLSLLWKATLRYDKVGIPVTVPPPDLPSFREALENGLKLAEAKDDISYLSYRLAVLSGRGADRAERERIRRLFDTATSLGAAYPWSAQALMDYAKWCEASGPGSEGLWTAYGGSRASRALELYERILRDFKPEESPVVAQAKARVEALTKPMLDLDVFGVFLPGSAIPVTLRYRNLRGVDLALYRLDLTGLPAPTKGNSAIQGWLMGAETRSLARVKSVRHDTSSTPGRDRASETFDLAASLPQGAYLLEASGGGLKDRQLLLVSDVALVVRASRGSAVVYACDVFRGAPVAGARVKLWAVSASGVEEKAVTAGPDGIATFRFKDREDLDLWAAARLGPRQAVATARLSESSRYDSSYDRWALYAFTDRPVYRPGQTVRWKVMARRLTDDGYETPAGQTLHYTISDGEGGHFSEGSVTLNAFGTAWTTLTIPESPKLGEYSIGFEDKDANPLAWASFFRVEEYRLPEFEVSVKSVGPEAKKKSFRPGERVEVTIGAEYYSGGPVPNAEVEVTVTQKPFQFFWSKPDPYFEYPDYDYAPEQVVKRETLRTGPEGTALLRFTAPAQAKGDVVLKVEAKVTDASRREVSGVGLVHVPLHPTFVRLTPDRLFLRPKEKVLLTAEAADVYEQPVGVEGTLRVLADEPREIWKNPEGKEVKGDDLAKVRQGQKRWPPPAGKDGKKWVLQSTTYEPREILKRDLATGENGKGTFTFDPPGEGVFRFEWTAADDPQGQRKARGLVKVAAGHREVLQVDSTYFRIVPDRQTLQEGEPLRALLVCGEPDSWVLLTLEGGGPLRSKLVHLSGTAQVVEILTRDEDAPSATLHADTLTDQIHLTDQEDFYLRTKRHTVAMEVTPERKEFLPRAEGAFRIRTVDWRGKPVSAEVALGVADASTFALQSDYAGEPSEVFRRAFLRSRMVSATSVGQSRYLTFKPHQGGKAALPWKPGVWLEGITYGSGAETGTIEGKVVDAQGQAIPGAEIIVTSKYLMGPRGTVTDLDGEFSMPFLVPGSDYRLIAEAQGYGKVVQSQIEVEFSSVTRITMTLAGTSEMTVSAAGPSWDSQRTNLTKEELESIPLNRETANILYLAPSAAYSGLGREDAFSLATLVVRSDFRETAFWKPDLVTGEDGTGEVTVKFPDGLTTWRATARAATAADAFGMGQANVRTDQPFLLRMEIPRFLVAQDEATLSAVVQNNTDRPLAVTCSLDAPGLEAASGGSKESVPLEIPARGQARADWRVAARGPAEAPLRMAAAGGGFSDGVKRELPVLEHGIECSLSRAGTVVGEEAAVTLDLPENRREGSTTLSVRVVPGVGGAILDALPYLVGYPYGCAEQTMSRFLPCVVTAKALKDQGLDPASALDGVLPAPPAPPSPEGGPAIPAEMKRLDDMVQKGLARLTGLHHPDGGWGWWEHDPSDRFMSAYVLWGLSLARRAGVKVDGQILKEGGDYLLRQMEGAGSDLPLQAWMLHAYSVARAVVEDKDVYAEAGSAFSNLWLNRKKLGDFELALLTLAARNLDRPEEAAELARDLAARATAEGTRKIQPGETLPQGWRGDIPGTAHWGSDGRWWHWSQGANEKTAFAIQALTAVQPDQPLVEAALTWLLGRRAGPRWASTRETAVAVLALSERLAQRESGATAVEVFANGRSLGSRTLSALGGGRDSGAFEVPVEFLRSGPNEIRIRKDSGGPNLYFTAEAKYFGREEPLPASGVEIQVSRRFVDVTSRPTLLKGPAPSRREMSDGETLESGARVECVLTLRALREMEYVVLEDMKPAGFEAVQKLSGAPFEARPATRAGREAAAPGALSSGHITGRMEVRDEKVAFFLTRLPAGDWEIRYELRAEVPGDFHVMPAVAYPMYSPDLRGSSAESRLQVRDKNTSVSSSP